VSQVSGCGTDSAECIQLRRDGDATAIRLSTAARLPSNSSAIPIRRSTEVDRRSNRSRVVVASQLYPPLYTAETRRDAIDPVGVRPLGRKAQR